MAYKSFIAQDIIAIDWHSISGSGTHSASLELVLCKLCYGTRQSMTDCICQIQHTYMYAPYIAIRGCRRAGGAFMLHVPASLWASIYGQGKNCAKKNQHRRTQEQQLARWVLYTVLSSWPTSCANLIYLRLYLPQSHTTWMEYLPSQSIAPYVSMWPGPWQMHF